MASTSMAAVPGAATGPKPVRDSSVRRWGIGLFVLVFVEGTLGMISAGSGLAGATPLLIAHIALGLGIVALSLWSLLIAFHFPRRVARLVTLGTTLAIVLTALTGGLFLATGFGQGGNVDRILSIGDLAGTALMIVWGAAEVEGDA